MNLAVLSEKPNKKLILKCNDDELNITKVNDLCWYNYNIMIYKIDDDNNEQLLLSLKGIYFDMLYAINTNMDLYKLIDDNLDNNVISNLILDEYGEVKGEFLSSFYNLYYIKNIEYNTSDKNTIKYVFKNLHKIIEYKDNLLVGNIIIKPKLNYEVNPNSSIEYYRYTEELKNLYELYIECKFKQIDESEYFIYTSE